MDVSHRVCGWRLVDLVGHPIIMIEHSVVRDHQAIKLFVRDRSWSRSSVVQDCSVDVMRGHLIMIERLGVRDHQAISLFVRDHSWSWSCIVQEWLLIGSVVQCR